MASNIAVQITQADLDNGKRGIPTECALALALTRHFQERASVCIQTAYLGSPDSDTNLRLHQDAIDFVRAFDGRYPLGPQVIHVSETRLPR